MQLEALGFKLAVFPLSALLAAAAALRAIYGQLRTSDSSSGCMGELYGFSEFSRLMGFERIWAFERAHAEDQLEDC